MRVTHCRLQRLAPGTPFRFGEPKIHAIGRPVEGITGKVLGPGSQGGVLVELVRKEDGARRYIVEEWSGAVSVVPLEEAAVA